MPWWGKSSKEGKRKLRKGFVVETVHGKFKIVSEEKGRRSGISRRHYTENVSENADNSSVNYRHPSPSLQVSCTRSCYGRSRAQAVPLQGGHTSASRLVDAKSGRSKRASRERVYQPSLSCSFYEPGHIVDTADGRYIDMEFMTASVSTYSSSGYETTRNTSTNCPSSLKLKDKSEIPSKQNSREILRPSNSLLNDQSVVSHKCKRIGSNVFDIQIPPRRVIHHEPLINSGFGSEKSHANTSPISYGHRSTPNLGHISGQNSVGGDVPELIYRKHSRCSPECSPTLSPRIASAGPSSRVRSASVSPLHPLVAGASPEPPIFWSDDRTKQSYRLPLPPVKTSSPDPMLRSSSTSPNSHFLRSSVQAENLPSPGPQWKKGRLLGSGTFGHVYLGFNRESGEMCAMKEVTLFLDDPKSIECARQLRQEIALLSQLHHPNIVQYYGSEMVDDNIYIYLEYVSGGSIHKVLQDYGPLSEATLRSFTKQILYGLAYLHAKNTVHRDVKGANILLQPGGLIKLADFGMAKHIAGEAGPMSFKGSPYWIAPELISNSNADVSVDIWSLGCTVLEMATGKPPWAQYEGVAALFKIGNSNELPLIPDYLSEEGKDFIRRCLQRDPLLRPSAAQLLGHPFVSLTPLERHISSPEPVEAIHLATHTGNPQSRNPQFLDPGTMHQTRGSRTVTPISNAHSPKNTSSPVSPTRNLLPQSQSPRYMSATKLSPPMLTPHGASGSSMPTGPNIGAIQFHHPRSPQHMSEITSPTSILTPRGRSSSPIRTVGNTRPCNNLQSPKHRCERLSPSPNSSPRAASGSSAHLAGGNVSFPFHTKSPTKYKHRDAVSTSSPHNSSYRSTNTSYQDMKQDMFQQVPKTFLIPQAILMHSSVRNGQTGRDVLRHPTESELANQVPQQRQREHVKFNYP